MAATAVAFAGDVSAEPRTSLAPFRVVQTSGVFRPGVMADTVLSSGCRPGGSHDVANLAVRPAPGASSPLPSGSLVRRRFRGNVRFWAPRVFTGTGTGTGRVSADASCAVVNEALESRAARVACRPRMPASGW